MLVPTKRHSDTGTTSNVISVHTANPIMSNNKIISYSKIQIISFETVEGAWELRLGPKSAAEYSHFVCVWGQDLYSVHIQAQNF